MICETPVSYRLPTKPGGRHGSNNCPACRPSLLSLFCNGKQPILPPQINYWLVRCVMSCHYWLRATVCLMIGLQSFQPRQAKASIHAKNSRGAFGGKTAPAVSMRYRGYFEIRSQNEIFKTRPSAYMVRLE